MLRNYYFIRAKDILGIKKQDKFCQIFLKNSKKLFPDYFLLLQSDIRLDNDSIK